MPDFKLIRNQAPHSSGCDAQDVATLTLEQKRHALDIEVNRLLEAARVAQEYNRLAGIEYRDEA